MNSCVIALVLFLPIAIESDYNLSVIHFNDFHARYEPVNRFSGPCQGPNCIGGISRLSATALNLLKTRPNSFFLNAGDNFQGSLWYLVYKWNVTQHFINQLPLNCLTIGNHEFDDGIDSLVKYLQHLTSPVVVANIDATNEPTLAGLYNKSVVLTRDGRKVGIIGVILKTTNLFANTGKLVFVDEIASVNEEAERLVQYEGVFTNIVLSHCGYDVDLEIARNARGKISLIVGGHTDTFLYTGDNPPGPDKPLGAYPTIVNNSKGEQILVVQASAYTKYLGNLSVFYHDNGAVSGWAGNPIFLDQTLPTNPAIDRDLDKWKRSVDDEGNKIVGNSLFQMMNTPCRASECLLGNFATDAMVFSYIDWEKTDNTSWTYASVAMVHAGGLRAGIDSGDITFSELVTTFPFEDTIDVIEIKGKHILAILESSMDDKHLENPHLYHVSGIRVVFNTNAPEGQRVELMQIRCRQCAIPVYENMQPEAMYRLIIPGFLTNTGFQPLFKKFTTDKIIGQTQSVVFRKFLKSRNPLYQEMEGRIIIKR